MQRSRAVVVLALVALLAGCSGVLPADDGGASAETVNATVTHVVDGDTIDVRLADGTEDRVRLLGIDTPEVRGENEPRHFADVPDTDSARACLRGVGRNASRYVGDRLGGESIRLEFDASADRRGDYDRLLAYVHHRGENVNAVLVDRGYAGVFPTTFRLRDRFETAAAEARVADRGLWRCG